MRRFDFPVQGRLKALFGSLVLMASIALVMARAGSSRAQAQPMLSITDSVGHVLISEPVMYLGHNVIGGSWKAATLQGIYQGQSPVLFESPRHRLAHYVVALPNQPADSRMVAVNFALCNGSWQSVTVAGIDSSNCLPFDVSTLATVQNGPDTPIVHVKRLLYADQQADIALWELAAPVDWSAVPLSNTIGDALTFGGAWVNNMYGQAIDRSDTPLPALLGDAKLTPASGAASIGDPTTPELGNTGYRVTHYDLALNFDADQGSLQGVATLTLHATYPQLARFSLDFSVRTARQITIDGQTANFQQDFNGHKLYIVPTAPLTYNQDVRVQVTYGGQLRTFNSKYIHFLPIGMFVDTQNKHIFDVDEPDGANSWFPCNDHPLNRATFTFHITVNEGLYAAANGTLQGDPVINSDGTRTFTWDMPQPMATYLAVIAIADYDPRPLSDTQGKIPLTIYAYAADADAAQQTFQFSDALMKLEIARFGPFPFNQYGQVLVAQQNVGMESQTMTVLPDGIAYNSEGSIFTLVGHEMSHQWYGDSVGLSTWGEIWLNEGFASYAEYLDQADSGNSEQAAALLRRWKADLFAFSRAESLHAVIPDDMFGVNSYEKGGYVLEMLRQKIGDTAFFKTMQTYAQRFAGRNATDDDFWAVAEEVSDQDLSQFFTQWLNYTSIPQVNITWTQHALPDGKSQIDALVCQNTTKPFALDVPVTLDASPNATETPTPMPSAAPGELDEILHVSGQQTVVHFTAPAPIGTWQIDPSNTVLIRASINNVNTPLPASCSNSQAASLGA